MINISLRFILCVFFLQYSLVAYSHQSSEKTKQSHPSSLNGYNKLSKKPANSLVKLRPSGDCSKSCKEIADKSNKKIEKPALAKQYQSNMVNVSYYDLPGNRTSNGEVFDPNKMTAAHKRLPFDTIVQLSNPENGKSVHVRINDRGPFVANRKFDVSKGAAEYLGIIKDGIATLQVKIIYQPSKVTGV